MSEVRKNSITGEWVIFAANRHNKPYHFKNRHQIQENEAFGCPFCPGHEQETPLAVVALPQEIDWEIRVFPNKYPALDEENGARSQVDDFYEALDGTGIHRVLVDTPIHGQSPETFSDDHLKTVFSVLQEQVVQVGQQKGIAYVQAFKNNGPMAGASVYHSHWQILGTPMVPLRQQKMEAHLLATQAAGKSCPYCQMLAHEEEAKVRLVEETAHFVSFVPYASRFPYEVWVLPRRHVWTIGQLEEAELLDLAKLTKRVLRKILALRPGLNYNLCLEDSPKVAQRQLFHWHLEIIPRMVSLAGFEFVSDSFINHVLPEQAAKELRQL